jgi:catechol 2,3-dioxygenase-like lactoylglutathione lyase family enzyme
LPQARCGPKSCSKRAAGNGPGEGPGFALDDRDFWIIEQEVAAGSVHIAFAAPDRETVDAFHAAALEAGGVDNGRPGLRPHYHSGYYAAFVLDPDS